MANHDRDYDDLEPDKGTGKRFVHTGVIDLRWDKDGNPTGYKGYKPYEATAHFTDDNGKSYTVRLRFRKRTDAISQWHEWHRRHENRDNPAYYQRKVREKRRQYTVADVINYYRSKNDSYIKDNDPRQSVLNYWQLAQVATSWIGKQNLFINKKHDWEQYFEELEGGEYTRKDWKTTKERQASTVNRLRRMVSRAFSIAIKDDPWDCMVGMDNPVKGIEIANSTPKKSRGLLPGEEDALADYWGALRASNTYYVPLAFYVAFETGMRREELVATKKTDGLKWSDVLPLADRRIRIRHSKTHKMMRQKHGATWKKTIAMSPNVLLYLHELYNALNEGKYLPNGYPVSPGVPRPIDNPDSQIFRGIKGTPMTGTGLSAAFKDTIIRAELKANELGEEFSLHSMRTVANDQYFSKIVGLDERHCNIMKDGHFGAGKGPYRVDYEEFLAFIQDEMDKAQLFTFKVDPATGKRVRNEYGEETKISMTLSDYLSRGKGRRVSIQEALETPFMGLSAIRTRWDTAKHRAEGRRRDAKDQERMTNEKVFVICGFIDHDPMSDRYMNLLEAVEVTKVQPSDLLSIDQRREELGTVPWTNYNTTTLYDGVGTLQANGYMFFSETWLKEHLAHWNLKGTVEEQLRELEANNIDLVEDAILKQTFVVQDKPKTVEVIRLQK
jgi:integrase